MIFLCWRNPKTILANTAYQTPWLRLSNHQRLSSSSSAYILRFSCPSSNLSGGASGGLLSLNIPWSEPGESSFGGGPCTKIAASSSSTRACLSSPFSWTPNSLTWSLNSFVDFRCRYMKNPSPAKEIAPPAPAIPIPAFALVPKLLVFEDFTLGTCGGGGCAWRVCYSGQRTRGGRGQCCRSANRQICTT